MRLPATQIMSVDAAVEYISIQIEIARLKSLGRIRYDPGCSDLPLRTEEKRGCSLSNVLGKKGEHGGKDF